mmetsp:Transcript_13810/g.35485  ORF Transcript_13810/g.35485 Transcript_13810/m.35485 type:complete len:115 (+) Transcript_13810:108-452(+)
MGLIAAETADGWTMVTTEAGGEGWVPSDFIQPRAAGGAAAPPVPAKPRAPAVPQKPAAGNRFKCVGTFAAESDQELSIKEGDVCTCDEAAVDGWMYVKFRGKEGYVPEQYLKAA